MASSRRIASACCMSCRSQSKKRMSTLMLRATLRVVAEIVGDVFPGAVEVETDKLAAAVDHWASGVAAGRQEEAGGSDECSGTVARADGGGQEPGTALGIPKSDTGSSRPCCLSQLASNWRS